jgi:hypothetical protein
MRGTRDYPNMGRLSPLPNVEGKARERAIKDLQKKDEQDLLDP